MSPFFYCRMFKGRTIASLALCSTLALPASAQHSLCDSDSTQAAEPFSFGDFTWLNGNARTHDSPLSFDAFTGEFRADVSYIADFNHPRDHTLSGTSESGRTGEIQLQQLGVGGHFHCGSVRGRLMTQFGMYSKLRSP